MALTIEQRPEKTLDNGTVSKWNASATPLQYKFSSDLFPVNTVDTNRSITSYIYSPSENGTVLTFSSPLPSSESISVKDYITIDGTGTIDGVYKVNATPTTTTVIIDLFTSEAGSGGTAIKYYKGYKALVKVFAGSPEYHPYNTDESKPQTEIGTIEVNFDQNNKGVCNVRNFIKPDMSADFDYDNENSHDAWTSFAIEYAEIYDNGPTPTFNEDILANCFPFSPFSNPNFNNGLTDWDQEPEGFLQSLWTSNASSVSCSFSAGTQYLYQDIQLIADQPYSLNIEYVFNRNLEQVKFIIFGYDGVSWNNYGGIGTIEEGTVNKTINFIPTKDLTRLALEFQKGTLGGNEDIQLNFAQVQSLGTNQCKYSSFSIFGAKQFQNSLGGNFGDYLANSEAPGKLLTNFESLKYPFYINSLIPASTFSQSEGGDSVFLETFIFDSKGVEKEYVRQQIQSKSDGVYTVNPEIETKLCEWDNGTTQIIAVPGNLLLDGDGGTYDNEDPTTWNITPIGIGSFVGSDIYPEGSYASFNFFTTSGVLNEVTYPIFSFDTEISTIIGEQYIVDSDFIITQNNLTPLVDFFIGIENISDEDIQYTFVSSLTTPNSELKGSISTVFTATDTSHRIQLKFLCKENRSDLNVGNINLKNTTVKGPIAYLTEKKPIKAGVCCGKTNQLLRWKNNLGGWDKWNFTRFRTFKENTKNKIEIQRDITQDWDNYFINGDTEYDYISQEVRQIMTLRSELLTQDEQKNLYQIRSSIRVQAFINDRWVTVTVKGGNYTLYDENEKIREVTFDIELPRTLTQEQ